MPMDNNKTQSDVERLQGALKASREEARRHRSRAQSAEAQLRQLVDRIEVLESRPPAPNLNNVLGGLAAIRSDLVAQLATQQAEIDDLRAVLDSYVRQP